MDDQQLIRFIDKRIPGRSLITDLQALAILHDDPKLMKLSDNLADIRQAIRGGTKSPHVNHFPDD